MSASEVADGWLRIERWLAAKAPLAHASLRAGVGAATVADAQRRLGLRFPEDLVVSLQRHDGCEPSRGHFSLIGPFRPVAVAGLTESHLRMEEVLAEFEGYWDRQWLMFADTSSDWGAAGRLRARDPARPGGGVERRRWSELDRVAVDRRSTDGYRRCARDSTPGQRLGAGHLRRRAGLEARHRPGCSRAPVGAGHGGGAHRT